MTTSNQVNAREYNAAFIAALDRGEQKKLAMSYEGYVRDKLREDPFGRKFLPLEPVDMSRVVRSIRHEQPVIQEEIEPTGRAMTISARGSTDAAYIKGERVEVGFYVISSLRWQKKEDELLLYKMDITQIIEKQIVNDMGTIEDREYVINTELAVQATQEGVNNVSGNRLSGSLLGYSASNVRAGLVAPLSIVKGLNALANLTDDFHPKLLDKGDMIDLYNTSDGTQLRIESVLIGEVDWNNWSRLTMDDVGSKVQSEVIVDGYRYTTIVGRKIVRTIKTNLLRTGTIYGFCDKEFLGRGYLLYDAKFWLDKIVNMIELQSWYSLARVFVNIRAIGKLELFSGSVTPGLETVPASGPLFTSCLPVNEEDIAIVNNRASSGLVFPRINNF